MRKRALFILTLMLLVGAVGARAAEAYTYFDSSNGRLTFCYDNNKSSISSKYTVYSLNTGTNNPAWRSIASSVKELYFNSDFANYRPTSCYGWAQNMTNLTKVTNISNLNTSSVTTMAYMFKDCSSLTFLDLNWSKFVTTNVTSMGYMFYGCSKLTTLYLGYSTTFNTANVTDFGFMFYGCSSLSSIRVSNFNTAKATYMVSMFKNCSGITSIDVSNFNTANAKSWMNEMFSGCSKLTSLDLSSFTIGSASGMLSGCSSLTYLKVPSSANNLPSTACTGVGTVGNPCTLDYPNGFTPSGAVQGDGYFKWKGGYFKSGEDKAYAVLSGSTLKFYYDGFSNLRTGTIYNLNTSTNAPAWNASASTVKTVEFDESFGKANPTSCYRWFYNMTNLTKVTNISNLNTSSVTTMAYMFKDCSSLTFLDLNWSKFVTTNVTSMGYMFYGCSKLTTLYLGYSTTFNTANVTDFGFMFYGCSSLSSIRVSNFNTAKATYMASMFQNCSSLTSLDLGTFNTAKVTNMSSMFSGCTKLGKLILYSDLGYMGNCEEYETEFVTTKVTNMKEMFKNCKALTTLQFPGLALTSSTTTTSMFSGCSAVTYFSVANNLTNAPAATFAGLGTAAKPCVLYSEYLPTDAKYTPTYLLWKGGYFKDKLRQAYAVYEESNKTLTFYYDNPEMWEMSEGGFSIYYIDDSATTPEWTDRAKAVTKVVFTNDFKYVRPTTCQEWFWDMSNLTTITGLNFLDTSEVEYMESMFWGCSRLKTLDLSSFNTEKVTTMRGMFSNCESLATLDLSSFNTEKVVAMNSMFLGCESLTSLDLSKFNTANVVNMNAMFLCCKKLSNLNLSSFNTAKVRDMSEMFYGCESLTSLDVSKFIIPANTRMMFTDCSGLKWLSIPSTASQLVYDEEFLYDPCQGVGTQAAPCTLVYPSGFTPEKTATGNGWYMWKGGYFKDADSYAMGDVNHDRAVSVVDVMLTVDYVLGNRPNVFYRDQADISNDGIITVADVISIVDLVLNSSPKMPRDFRSSAADRLYLAPAEGQCQLLLDNSEPFAAMQFTIVVPEGAKVSDIALEAARANGHSVRMQQLTPTRYNVVVFAANGEPLRNGEKALLRFDIDGCQPDDIDIEEAQLVNGFRETVQPDFGGVATGIAEIATDGDTQPYYNTVGVKVKTPNRGVYIHNSRKVVVK